MIVLSSHLGTVLQEFPRVLKLLVVSLKVGDKGSVQGIEHFCTEPSLQGRNFIPLKSFSTRFGALLDDQ